MEKGRGGGGAKTPLCHFPEETQHGWNGPVLETSHSLVLALSQTVQYLDRSDGSWGELTTKVVNQPSV